MRLARSQVTAVAGMAVVGERGVPWEQSIFNPGDSLGKDGHIPGRMRGRKRRSVGPPWRVEGSHAGGIWADGATQVSATLVWGGAEGAEEGWLLAGVEPPSPTLEDPIAKPSPVGWDSRVGIKANTSGIPGVPQMLFSDCRLFCILPSAGKMAPTFYHNSPSSWAGLVSTARLGLDVEHRTYSRQVPYI